MKEHKKSKTSGITLIALVVTIIVLLILAGISIMMLSGNNGVLKRAGEARDITEEEQIIEEARMDILSIQTEKLSDRITERDLKSILSKYGTLSTEEENILDKKLTTSDEKYVIPVSKIYNENLLEATIENTDQKSYYGDSIDYDVDIGVSLDDKDQYDWKIFYNDGTNIYIIAEDYVRMDNSLMPTIPGRANGKAYPYSLFWSDKSGNIENEKDGSADIFGDATHNVSNKTINFANKYLAEWKRALGDNTSKNISAKMVATLVDTDLWSYNSLTEKGFTNSEKINSNSTMTGEFFAIGGPTIEMWVKSWNQKHGTDSEDTNKLQLYYASNATGYFVGTSKNPDINLSYSAYQSGTTGYNDLLYYPNTTEVNGCNGYWLASPTAVYTGSVKAAYFYGYIGFSLVSRYNYGIRPVVCLPSDITAKWNEADEVWNIIKK